MKVAAQQTITDRVMSALATASERTGIGFDYLMKTAARESAFNPSAKAPSSSATGLFQFIDSTWLGVVRENGSRFGLNEEAAAIEPAGRGKFRVSDPQMRSHIMALRKDPEVAALMAGAFTEDNADYLRKAIGRDPSEGELYIAHFLGAGGAAKMIELAETSPDEKAASHFPAAAQANRSIFYKRGGARSISDVYDNLVAKHEHTMTPNVAPHPGASSPRIFNVPKAKQPILAVPAPAPTDSRPMLGLFQSNGQSALGPSAQGGMKTASLFTTPGAQTSPIVAKPVPVSAKPDAVAEVKPAEPASRPRSMRRFSMHGANDAAAIRSSHASSKSAVSHQRVDGSESAATASAKGDGFASIFNGLASLFGFGRGA
ncbi:MAG: transglycosylase SLT domain-containing protein [Tepidamorphaceae bacterium]